MVRCSGSAASCLCIAAGAVLFAACQPSGRKYQAEDFFADPKVAELAEAAREGDIERVDAVIAQGVKVNARGEEGLTPLMYSMSGTSTKGLQRLLKRGADPNLQTELGDSAASFAAHRKESESLKILLAHGADPNLRSRPAARFTGNYCPTPIYDAIRGRNPDNARILIKAGADLNVRDSDGRTTLMCAATLRSYDVMYVLLEAGADFRATGPMGYSVTFSMLMGSIDPKSEVFKSRQKCIEFMEKKGVDFEQEKVKNAEIERQNEEKLKREEQNARGEK